MSVGFTNPEAARHRRGQGVLEFILSMGLLGLMMAATALTLRHVLAAQHKIDQEAGLIQQFQTLGARIQADVTASCPQGLTVESQGLAALSPENPQYTGLYSHLLWKSYHMYRWDSARKEVLWLKQPLSTPTDLAVALPSLPTTGGQSLARGVDLLEFEQDGPMVRMRIAGSQVRYRGVEKVEYEMAALCRNP